MLVPPFVWTRSTAVGKELAHKDFCKIEETGTNSSICAQDGREAAFRSTTFLLVAPPHPGVTLMSTWLRFVLLAQDLLRACAPFSDGVVKDMAAHSLHSDSCV